MRLDPAWVTLTSMSGKQIYLTVKQGVNFDYEFSFDDGNTPAAAIDISDRSFKSQMRLYSAAPLAAEFICEKRDQTVEAFKGKMRMRLTYQQTAVIPEGLYAFDVIQTLADGTRDELCSGTVNVVPSITRD